MKVGRHLISMSYLGYSSVRGMQYVLDMNLNTKKPDDLVHFLPYK